MFNSPVFQNSDLEQLYSRQFSPMGTVYKEDTTMGEIMELEEEHSPYGYSVIGEEQPEIEIKTEVISNT